MRITPIRVALAGLLCAVLFQFFVVQGLGGNWTVPFYAGEMYPPPPELRGKVYQVPNSYGFDGQFYHYMARDFWDTRGTSQYVDDPRLRWQRALLPGMAALLSFGHPDFAAPAYIGVVWLLCGLGLWLLARIFVHFGYPVAFGLGFFAIPAVLVSLDRMMTDIALVVAILAVVYGSLRQMPGLVYGALVLAPLARETGFALIAGWVLFQLWQRAWRPAMVGCLTALPFLGWSIWVSQRYPGDPAYWLGAPFSGILRRLLQPAIYETPVLGFKLAAATDYLGAWGIASAFVLVIGLFLRGERSLLIFAALVYTLGIALFAKDDMWGEAYSYTRTGGPAAVMLALIGVEQRRWWLVAPMLLALPRIVLQYGAVAWVSLRGWL